MDRIDQTIEIDLEATPFDTGGRSPKRGLFNLTVTALTTLLGGLSIASLLQQGVQFGWALPIQAIMHWYDRAVQISLGWAAPWINELLTVLPWNLSLQDNWQHGLVGALALVGPLPVVTFRDRTPLRGMLMLFVVPWMIGVLTLAPGDASERSRMGFYFVAIAVSIYLLALMVALAIDVSTWSIRRLTLPRHFRILDRWNVSSVWRFLAPWKPVLAATLVVLTSAGLSTLGL
jgi:hypothetical protein